MPWTIEDVDVHKGGLTATQKKHWMSVANGARETCLAAGNEEKECDGRAIRMANAALNAMLAIEAENTNDIVDISLDGDIISLVERSIREDGTIPIKLIAPGWGSSGYYPAEVLERDGSKVFKAQTHLYWNHPSVSEDKDRPERDLRDLAGTLTKDAYWDANGVAGPGLYGEAHVVSAYRDTVKELAPYIGMSIRANGRVKEGEADGRKGKVIEELVSARSVDFVTAPGAGGRILELFEAAGRSVVEVKERIVNEEEAKALRDENTTLKASVAQQIAELARLQEGLLLRQAQDVARTALEAVEMPIPTRQRVLAAQSAKPIAKEDGTLDEAAFTAQVKEAARVELVYINEVRGSGKIVGMGDTSGAGSHAALVESFVKIGLDPKSAEIAATGR